MQQPILEKLLAEVGSLSIIVLVFSLGMFFQKLCSLERWRERHTKEHIEISDWLTEIASRKEAIDFLKIAVEDIKASIVEIQREFRDVYRSCAGAGGKKSA